MNVTLYDICKKTGLSTATVSRVINNNPHVLEATRKRVQDAMDELNYFPTHAARMLKRKQTDTLGVIFPDIANGYFAEVLRGIHIGTRECGRQLQVTFYDHDDKFAETLQQYAMERRADGLVVFNPHLTKSEMKNVRTGKVPVVFLACPVKGPNYLSVTLDNRDGVERVLSHFLECGYRDIAILGGPRGGYDTDVRMQAAVDFLAQRNIDLPPDRVWVGGYSAQSGQEAVSFQIQSGIKLPEAVFALNDAMAIGVLQGLEEYGLRVPADVAVAGFDDSDIAHYAGLTSVRVPTVEMGIKACELAMTAIESEKPLPVSQRSVMQPVELVVRRSSVRV